LFIIIIIIIALAAANESFCSMRLNFSNDASKTRSYCRDADRCQPRSHASGQRTRERKREIGLQREQAWAIHHAIYERRSSTLSVSDGQINGCCTSIPLNCSHSRRVAGRLHVSTIDRKPSSMHYTVELCGRRWVLQIGGAWRSGQLGQ